MAFMSLDPQRRCRRTAGEIRALRYQMATIIGEAPPMTVRQIFYQMLSRGHIDKQESEYKNVVVRLTGRMREEGQIPFSWIADPSRWMRKPQSYGSLRAMLNDTRDTYRRDIWRNQDDYVEVWLEKEALSGVIYETTAQWDVPLFVAKGYASKSYLHEAAKHIESVDKPTFLYYLGDYDPSGLDISRNIEEKIRQYAPRADITFERIAVTEDQIYELDLPTRPTKRSDSRSKSFKGESVEVDAIPPKILRALVREAIESHVNTGVLSATKETERLEKVTYDNAVRDIFGGLEL